MATTGVLYGQSMPGSMGMLSATNKNPSPLTPNLTKWHDITSNILGAKPTLPPEFKLPLPPKKRLQQLRLLVSPGPFRGFAFAYRFTWQTTRMRTVRYAIKPH